MLASAVPMVSEIDVFWIVGFPPAACGRGLEVSANWTVRSEPQRHSAASSLTRPRPQFQIADLSADALIAAAADKFGILDLEYAWVEKETARLAPRTHLAEGRDQ
jgi:hypothetical protein